MKLSSAVFMPYSTIWTMERKSSRGPPCPWRKRTNREPDSPPEDFAALPDGHGNRARFAGSVAGYWTRRIRGHHGAVRVRQVDADESGRLPRHPHGRDVRAE